MAEQEEIILRYKADTSGATGPLEELQEQNDSTAASVGGVNEQLGEVPGAAGAAARGIKTVQVALKALLANPIILVISAIVAGLAALYKAFTRTAAGGDTMAKIFEGLSAAIGPVLDALGKLAAGLVEFFKGNFSAGIDQMKGSFDGLGTAIGEAVRNAARLVDLRRELQQMNRDLIVAESELSKQMEIQRSVLDDTSRPIEERIAANNRLQELNLELLKSREELIAKQREQAELELEQAGLDDEAHQEALNRIAELTAAQNNAEAERFRVEKEFVVKRNELETQKQQQEAVHAQVRINQVQSENDQLIQLDNELTGQLITNGTNIDKEKQKWSEADLKRIAKEQAARQQLFSNTAQILNATASLAGKNVGLQKALGVASAVVSTYTAAAQALADPTAITPVQKFINVAAVIATGIAQVRSIIATPVPGGQGGGGGVSLQQPTFNSIAGNNGGFNNANPELPQNVAVTNFENQPPARAYVLEGDITSAQEAKKNLEGATEL